MRRRAHLDLTRARLRASARVRVAVAWLGLVALGLVALVVGSGGSAVAATSSTVVGATVPSVTELDASGCESGTPDVTDFGVVTVGSLDVTGLDCVVTFGSSNDTAMLRVRQTDGLGQAMFANPSGPLDSAFNGTGSRIIDPPTCCQDRLYAVTALPSGQFLGVGATSSADVRLMLYDPDGTLDETFDGDSGTADGEVVLDTGVGVEILWAVQVLPDGRFVAAGRRSNDMVAMRFLSDGRLDTTFNGTGWRAVDFSGVDEARSIDVDESGRVVIAGAASIGVADDAAVARITTDGLLDTTFSGDGRHSIDFGGVERFSAVAARPTGEVVAVGPRTGTANLVTAQWGADGLLDPAWNGGGSAMVNVAHDPPDPDLAYGGIEQGTNGLVLQDDGKVVYSARQWNGAGSTSWDVGIYRLTTTGTLDLGFDGDGIQTFELDAIGHEYVGGIVQHPDGSISVGGSADAGTSQGVSVVRVTSTGAIDTSFGDGSGSVVIDLVPGEWEEIGGLAIIEDGRLAAVAREDSADDKPIAMVFDTERIDDYLSATSDWDTVAPDDGAFGACLRAASGGAATGVGTWQVDAGNDCAATDLDAWNAVPSSAEKVARTGPMTSGARVDLRFGFRVRSNQPPGRYLAPITFETVAPDA